MTRKQMIDQAMRSSVTRALKLQPRKAQRLADELLYAAPAEREAVAALHAAGARLVEARLAVPSAGAVAARHGSASMTVSRRSADLTQLDARHLVRITLEGDAIDDDAPDAAGVLREVIRVGAAAAVWAHPVSLLACAAVGFEPELSVSDELSELAETVTVIPGRGAVAAGDDPMDAVARLEAAERLAEITLAVRRFGA